jgi:hypothetical protein
MPASSDPPAYAPITYGFIRLSLNLWALTNQNCDRVRKVVLHEVGHLLGLGHMTQSLTPSVMKQGTLGVDQWNGVDHLSLDPSCSDVEAANEAWNFRGPSPPQYGDIGGIGGCGPDEYSDSSGCCHPREVLLFAPAVGHHNRRPTIAVESPTNNSMYAPWSTISFNAHTLDLDGSVKRVFWAHRTPGGPGRGCLRRGRGRSG